jgi:hypothetical protein
MPCQGLGVYTFTYQKTLHMTVLNSCLMLCTRAPAARENSPAIAVLLVGGCREAHLLRAPLSGAQYCVVVVQHMWGPPCGTAAAAQPCNTRGIECCQ